MVGLLRLFLKSQSLCSLVSDFFTHRAVWETRSLAW